MKIDDALALHRDALDLFFTRARALDEALWHTPRAEGKWSASEVTTHVTMTYDVLLQELSGGGSMKIRTPLWMRILLRVTLVPRLLAGKPFPKNAPAPRELRPPRSELGRDEALERLRIRASEFEEVASAAGSRRPPATVTHPYFGRFPAGKAVIFCARHTRHHSEQLLAPGSE